MLIVEISRRIAEADLLYRLPAVTRFYVEHDSKNTVADDAYSSSDSGVSINYSALFGDSANGSDTQTFQITAGLSDGALISEDIQTLLGRALYDSTALSDSPAFDLSYPLDDSGRASDDPLVEFTAVAADTAQPSEAIGSFDVLASLLESPVVSEASVINVEGLLADSSAKSESAEIEHLNAILTDTNEPITTESGENLAAPETEVT